MKQRTKRAKYMAPQTKHERSCYYRIKQHIITNETNGHKPMYTLLNPDSRTLKGKTSSLYNWNLRSTSEFYEMAIG